ncbi:uncharacterized protein METZ01_LOCUS121888, partial [marine metagenome]
MNSNCKRPNRMCRSTRSLAFALAGILGAGTAHAQDGALVSLQQDPTQWVMPNGNYAAWNYSP